MRAALRLTLLSAPLLGGSACSLLGTAFAPAPPPAPPVELPFDLYEAPDPRLTSGALPPPAVETPEGAARTLQRNPALLEHLKQVDARYSGRRLPKLTWTASVQRILPEDEDGDEPYWTVDLASSPIRGSPVYYGCAIRVSESGAALDSGPPEQICAWREKY